MGLLNQPRLARTAKQGLMTPLEIQMDTMINDPLRPNLSSRLTQQDLINKGLMAIGMAPMGMTGPVKVFRAGNQQGLTANSGGPTFYSTQLEGALPYARGNKANIVEETINPKNVFDAKKIEHRNIYEEFLKEGNHPFGYGKTARPFWTAEYSLRPWLKKKGYDFDAVMFDENTGIPSYAVYGSNLKP